MNNVQWCKQCQLSVLTDEDNPGDCPVCNNPMVIIGWIDTNNDE